MLTAYGDRSFSSPSNSIDDFLNFLNFRCSLNYFESFKIKVTCIMIADLLQIPPIEYIHRFNIISRFTDKFRPLTTPRLVGRCIIERSAEDDRVRNSNSMLK